MARTFIAGDDDFLVDRKAREVYEKLASGSDEFSREILDGHVSNQEEASQLVDRVRAAGQTLSLFGDRKTVWLRGLNWLSDTPTGRSEGGKELMARLQADIEAFDPDGVDIIVSATPVDRRRREFKWFKEHCTFHDCALPKGESDRLQMLMGVARNSCEEEGLSVDEDALSALVGRVGSSLRLLVEEIRKLSIYLGKEERRLEESLVLELVPSFGEGDRWEMTDAFFALDLRWTLDAIRRHFFIHKEARPLLAALQNRNRLLIQLRALDDAGRIRGGLNKNALAALASEYAEHFGEAQAKSGFHLFSQHPFYLGKCLQVARSQQLNLRRLINFQQAFLEAFEDIIRWPQEHEAVMSQLAVKCLGSLPSGR